jgi:hypothetical protein
VNELPSTRDLPVAPASALPARLFAPIAAVLAFAIPAALLIASGRIPGRVFSDQRVYHEPAIRQFVQHWPRVDLFDYLSATTPGYHLFLATLLRGLDALGLSTLANAPATLQGASALITCLWLAILAWWLTRWTTPARAALALLPLATSMYVLQAGAWVLPDNAGWLGVTLMLMLALSPRLSQRHILAAGLTLLALVFTRQNHLWTASLIVVSAWMSIGPRVNEPWEGSWSQHLTYNTPRRISRSLFALLACLPAVLLLTWLVTLWGGLTPPRFHTLHQGFNLATPGFVLAVIGFGSIIFAGTLWCPVAEAFMEWRRWLAVAAIISLALALATPTTYSMEAGRWSGLWNIAARLPAIGNYASVLMVPLAVLGGVVIASCFRRLWMRERIVILAALASFSLAQSANAQLWQRYVEPMVLILLAYLIARVGHAARTHWRELALPILAALAFTAASFSLPATLKGGGLFTWPKVTDTPTEQPFDLPTKPKNRDLSTQHGAHRETRRATE